MAPVQYVVECHLEARERASTGVSDLYRLKAAIGFWGEGVKKEGGAVNVGRDGIRRDLLAHACFIAVAL